MAKKVFRRYYETFSYSSLLEYQRRQQRQQQQRPRRDDDKQRFGDKPHTSDGA